MVVSTISENRFLEHKRNNDNGLLRGTTKEKVKRRDIQGLRGLAIIYVMLFHLYPKLFPHGFLGVDIFFVISGYLMTMTLWTEQPVSFAIFITFYKKRILRLFPAYYMFLFLLLVYGLYSLTKADFRLIQTDTLWAASFLSNLHKYLLDRDYFAEVRNYDFLLHTWSIAVEIQFYLVAPFLVLILASGTIGKIFCFAVFVASIYFNLSANGPLQFSSIFSRIWQFMCGSIAYFSPTAMETKALTIIAFLVLLTPLLPISLEHSFFRFMVTAASGLIISLDDKFARNHLLGNEYLYFIGEISYSVYLFHWPVIVFIKYASNLNQLVLIEGFIAAELSVLVGALSYRFVEKTFLQRNFFIAVIFLTVVIGSIFYLIFGSSVKAQTIVKTVDITLQTGRPLSKFEKYCYHFRDIPYLPENVNSTMLQEAIIKNRQFTHRQLPNYTRQYKLQDYLYHKHFIMNQFYLSFPDYFKGNGSLTMAVIGNSFAYSAFHAIVETLFADIKEIRLLSHITCQPFLGFAEDAVPEMKSQCRQYSEKTAVLIHEMKPDVIFIIFLPLGSMLNKYENIEQDDMMESIQKTIDSFSLVSKAIFLQMPIPITPNTFYTFVLLKSLEKKQSLKDVHIKFREFRQTYHYAIKRLEHVKCDKCIKIYPHKIFCDSEVCRVFDPENLFSFYDSDYHMNVYAHKCIRRLYRESLDETKVDGYFE